MITFFLVGRTVLFGSASIVFVVLDVEVEASESTTIWSLTNSGDRDAISFRLAGSEGSRSVACHVKKNEFTLYRLELIQALDAPSQL